MIRINQKKTILSLFLTVVAVVTVSVLFSGCSKEETYRLVKVNSYDGEVSVQREEKLNAFEGLQLVSNDTVSVGDKAFLELLADSDKHIAAEENTGFVLHSTGDENNGDITIDLLYGKSLFTIDNKLTEGSTFSVNTPNATLSVRGTSFSVAYDEETKTTDVEVYSGTVQLNSGDEEMLIEKDGTATITTTEDGVKIITNSTAGNPNAIAVPENTEKLFAIAMTYPQQEGYSALNAEYKAKASDYTVKETGISDNDIVFQKFIGLIKNHNADISKFFEENKANAVANTNKQTDVTDWFKEKITVGDKKFRIVKAIMDISIYGSNIERKYITSDTYKVNTEGIDMYFCANGVEISFYGGFEKAEVVTTTTTTTTVPETTVPETTTVETTTTTTATTTVPKTTTEKITTVSDTTEKNSTESVKEKEHYIFELKCSYSTDKNHNEHLVQVCGYGSAFDFDLDATDLNGKTGAVKFRYNVITGEFLHSSDQTTEEAEPFALELIKYVKEHDDDMKAAFNKHKKNNFSELNSDKYCGYDFYDFFDNDISDWFPDSIIMKLNPSSRIINISRIPSGLRYYPECEGKFIYNNPDILCLDWEVEKSLGTGYYEVVDPKTGENRCISGFSYSLFFYGTVDRT